MTPFVPRALAATAVLGLLLTAAPGFAAGARPLDTKITFRPATDEYCVDAANVAGPGVASLLPTAQCQSKRDWAAARLAISRD